MSVIANLPWSTAGAGRGRPPCIRLPVQSDVTGPYANL